MENRLMQNENVQAFSSLFLFLLISFIIKQDEKREKACRLTRFPSALIKTHVTVSKQTQFFQYAGPFGIAFLRLIFQVKNSSL